MIRGLLKSSFFRHSAWVTFAAFAGGGAMMLVQIIAGKMPQEYLLFIALLDIVGLMAIPTLGIQAALAHQTASANSPAARAQVAANARAVFFGVVLLWVIAACFVAIFHSRLLSAFDVPNWVALPITLLAGLSGMASPIAAGMLQGKQDFVWYGWASLLNGAARCAAVAVTVMLLRGRATAAITAVLIGSALTLGLMIWRTRDLWRLSGGVADRAGLVRQILPVSLMIGVPTFLFTYDSVVVKQAFGSADDYGAARLIGRTLVFITAPMVYVMFPKIVQSAARSEKTNVLAQTLGVTALFGAAAATVLTIVPWLPLKVLWGDKYLTAEYLVPWFAWCMLPLALANVLINNLLARQQFSALPWLAGVAVLYGLTLQVYKPTLLAVVQLIGLFGVVLCATSAFFSFRKPRISAAPPSA